MKINILIKILTLSITIAISTTYAMEKFDDIDWVVVKQFDCSPYILKYKNLDAALLAATSEEKPNFNLIEALIQFGANVDTHYENNVTPLHRAVRRDSDIVWLLLENVRTPDWVMVE